MIRLQIFLFLMSLILAIYGVKEIREALEDGSALRDGMEALMMSGVFPAIGFWLNRFRPKGRIDPFDIL